MTLVRQNQQIEVPTAATIGMFDGMHVGHRHVVATLQEYAKERHLASAVVTFSEHPRSVVHPDEATPMLMTADDKIAALETTGIDYVVMLDFDREMAQLSARDFICFLRRQFNVRFLLIGYDHRFGHNRSESFPDYVRYGWEEGVEVARCPEFFDEEGEKVASSVVRQCLAEGDVEKAARLLTQPFRLEGMVVEGYRNGRKLGFPTANIQLCDNSLIVPQNGVYAVRVHIEGMGDFNGMLNIGYRPTIDNGAAKRSIEVNIFNFSGNIYGYKIAVDFIARLRSEKKWASLDELKRQLADDKQKALQLLNKPT